MSALVWALILGPIGGLILEWIGGTRTGSASRLVQLVERVKSRLDPQEQNEADEAIAETRGDK